MELFNLIAGGASIVSLVVSLFVAAKVVKISNVISVNSKVDSEKVSQKIKGDRNTQIGNMK